MTSIWSRFLIRCHILLIVAIELGSALSLWRSALRHPHTRLYLREMQHSSGPVDHGTNDLQGLAAQAAETDQSEALIPNPETQEAIATIIATLPIQVNGIRLRPRQLECVERAMEAIRVNGDTLIVAPTGAGKTVILSEIIGRLRGKTLVIAHRDELTSQNLGTFERVNAHRSITTSKFDSRTKSWEGDVVFGMVQTLARADNLKSMPFFDNMVIDESHHAVAKSYMKILEKAKSLNSDLNLLGLTATPNRGDKKGLGKVFSNVADQISLTELVVSDHLVPPRTFAIDKIMDREKLSELRKVSGGEYDMGEAAKIMNVAGANELVVNVWRLKASDRQTVVFCSTVAHARDVYKCFKKQGFSAALLHGNLGSSERSAILEAYAKGEIQVLTNCMVLTEGWDDQRTSCIVLLRPCSFKSTYVQMVGRGLRAVDPAKHPHVTKTDCIVLDFGASSALHGSLEQELDLEGKEEVDEGDAEVNDGTDLMDRLSISDNLDDKACPVCQTSVLTHALVCHNCGHKFGANRSVDDLVFQLKEIDMLQMTRLRWVRVSLAEGTLLLDGYDPSRPLPMPLPTSLLTLRNRTASAMQMSSKEESQITSTLQQSSGGSVQDYGCDVMISSCRPDGPWGGVFFDLNSTKWYTVVDEGGAKATQKKGKRAKKNVRAIAASESRYKAIYLLNLWAQTGTLTSPTEKDQNERSGVRTPLSSKQYELIEALLADVEHSERKNQLTHRLKSLHKHEASVLITMLINRNAIRRAIKTFALEHGWSSNKFRGSARLLIEILSTKINEKAEVKRMSVMAPLNHDED